MGWLAMALSPDQLLGDGSIAFTYDHRDRLQDGGAEIARAAAS
jgi:hypothetical protein